MTLVIPLRKPKQATLEETALVLISALANKGIFMEKILDEYAAASGMENREALLRTLCTNMSEIGIEPSEEYLTYVNTTEGA